MTRVIGIAGCSYCGSTLLDRILGSLPGVVALGETHWIVDAYGPDSPYPWTSICGQHGKACQTFTPAVLADLRAGGWTGWFDRLAEVVGNPDVLVSSDKGAGNFRKIGMPDVFVVPYRNPADMLRSFAKRDRNVIGAARAIRDLFGWLARCGVPFVTLDTDLLADDAEGELRRLCTALDLPWSDAALHPWGLSACVFGGNSARTGQFGGQFTASDPTPAPGTGSIVAIVRDAIDGLLAAE